MKGLRWEFRYAKGLSAVVEVVVLRMGMNEFCIVDGRGWMVLVVMDGEVDLVVEVGGILERGVEFEALDWSLRRLYLEREESILKE